MPEPFDISQVEHHVDAAEEAAADARAIRHALRWKAEKGDPARQEQLASMLRIAEDAMRPIRSYIGRLMYEDLPDALEGRLRDVSRDLQHQRRSLKRML